MRLMGLDVGSKTIGVALSDPLGLTAQGFEVIRRRGEEKDLARLRDIIGEKEVSGIVVGLPKNMNGTMGPQSDIVREFASLIEDSFDLPVIMWDERLSTIAAEKMLISADVSRGKRKQVIDKMAAVMILQGYLDSKAKYKERENG
ncbi:Holliday junction resolvase RuvX [Phosphitispora sp. TUW77]|uniref:Holliday junction resolvase RuvX n=1 Tax=Phosphitispora sp. TUW77 TaxID=3152361 RepID=UPI003AB8A61E